jgi:hypothetical protein
MLKKNWCRVYTTHFSIFALFGNVQEVKTDIKVYPNPYYAGKDDLLLFTDVYPSSNLRIYTISGELIKILEDEDKDGKIEWDARNEKGCLVASGIYLYITKGASGKKVNGKVGVVR